MTTDTDVIQGIADTLQRVYGDAAQTSLDRQAASEVWASLQMQGVVPWAVVAAIVQAAGGQVTIPYNVLDDPPTEMMIVDDPLSDAKIVKVRHRTTKRAPQVEVASASSRGSCARRP